jgi:hypothetical protein
LPDAFSECFISAGKALSIHFRLEAQEEKQRISDFPFIGKNSFRLSSAICRGTIELHQQERLNVGSSFLELNATFQLVGFSEKQRLVESYTTKPSIYKMDGFVVCMIFWYAT